MIKSADLMPYVEIAQSAAKTSPCLRRKYGAVIVDQDDLYTVGVNERVGKCCSGKVCARTRLGLTNGERTEVGGEVHAEISALIKHYGGHSNSVFILVGFSGNQNQPLWGRESYPCHACAMAIKHAGFKFVYLMDGPEVIKPYSINQIIVEREQEWEPAD